MSTKTRVNNSLTTKHSMSKGWDFCVSTVVAVPVPGGSEGVLARGKPDPGSSQAGERNEAGHLSGEQPHTSPRRTRSAKALLPAQPLETVRNTGRIPQLPKKLC